MLKDITLGQFFPGNSFLHKLDPRMKIILTIIYIADIFLCKNLYSFCYITAFTFTVLYLSGIPFKVIAKSLKPLLFILMFTVIYNVFFYNGDTLLVDLKIVDIYYEGIVFAVLTSLRIICLLAGSSLLLTYTTSPISLTDGLERLLAPLSKLKIPVHEFSMMMTIALRFIPALIEETDKIMSAQKARGTNFSTGGLIKRAKALIPVIIPLFLSSFRRASDLAMAMECRCYRGGEGRTRMTVLHLSYRDFIALFAMIVSLFAIILLNTCLSGISL